MATLTSAQTIYSSPDASSYWIGKADVGTVLVKFKEGSYYYIQFTDTITKEKMCGYVPADQVSGAGSVSTFTPTMSVRYVNTTVQGRWGPGIAYAEAVPLPRGALVYYLNKKEDGYAMIQYTAGGRNYRCYVDATKLSTGSITTTSVSKTC